MVRPEGEFKDKKEWLAKVIPVRAYDATIVTRVFDLAKIGLTQREIAKALGIHRTMLEKWLQRKEELAQAWAAGKDIFDHGVQQTLLQRAMGYEYEEIKEVDGVDSQGRPYRYTTKTVKKVLPEVTAMIFWLKNRHRETWADVHKQESTLNLNMEKTLRLELLNEKERELVKSIAIKNLSVLNDINDN